MMYTSRTRVTFENASYFIMCQCINVKCKCKQIEYTYSFIYFHSLFRLQYTVVSKGPTWKGGGPGT